MCVFMCIHMNIHVCVNILMCVGETSYLTLLLSFLFRLFKEECFTNNVKWLDGCLFGTWEATESEVRCGAERYRRRTTNKIVPHKDERICYGCSKQR